MVKLILVVGEDDYVCLTTGYLLKMEDIRKAVPKAPSYLRVKRWRFSSRDEATAWTLSALCRRAYAFRPGLGGNVEAILHVAHETWLLGPPATPQATFASWFEHDNRPLDYRIIIHRTPAQIGGQRVKSTAWDYVYRSTPRPLERDLHLTQKQKTEANAILNSLLDHLQIQPKETTPFFENLGHSYWSSDGLPGIS